MADDDGPTGIDIGPRDDFAGTMEALRRQLPALVEYLPILAEFKKAQFDALVAQGFTPAQALQLIPKGIEI